MSFAVGQWVQVSFADAWRSGRIVGVNYFGNWIVQYVSGRQEFINRQAAERIMQHDYVCPLPVGFKMQHNQWAR